MSDQALSNEEMWEDARNLAEQVSSGKSPDERAKAHDDYLAQGDNRTVEPRQTQRDVASTTTSDVAGGGAYDPSGYTVEEVRKYVTDNPDQLDAVRKAEKKGKGRSGLLDWFDTQ